MSRRRPRDAAVVADVGGTRLRAAVRAADGSLSTPVDLACADHDTITSALAAAFDRLGPSSSFKIGALAVAGPVFGDQVSITNRAWRFSVEQVRRALGLERLVVVNDLEATALALPHLARRDLEQIGGGEPEAEAPKVVLAAGTGLGVAGLVRGGSGWTALAGEGGHVDLAPADAREAELLGDLRQRFGHVSLERVLSGAGLVNLYRAIAAVDGAPPEATAREVTPEEISRWSITGRCPLAAAATLAFSRFLGAAAGNFVLVSGARGGAYLCGGTVLGLGAAFDRQAFRRRFEDKGRFVSYLAPLPAYLITAANPALEGLASLLAQDAR